MAETINRLVDNAIARAYASRPDLFAGYPEVVVRDAFSAAMTEIFPKYVELSTVRPDYESVILQLVNELSKDATWYDFITAGTGQALIRYIAAGITYGQFSIERALQEAFPHTASSESAVYAVTDLLGVRIQRVIPATVTVRFTRTDKATLLEVPRFTPFSIRDVAFFNRERIIFPVDTETLDIVLTQGQVQITEVPATGQPFLDIELGDGTKDISDIDVWTFVDGTEWIRSVENIWNFKELDENFWDHTTPSGNLMVSFGSGIFGKVPSVNKLVRIVWVRCLGEKGNYYASDLDVAYKGPSINTQLDGVTISNISGARDMLDANFYSIMAPHMRAAGQTAVRRSDYRRFAVEFPSIKDALVRGQAELGPHKRSMMNVLGITLLSDAPINPVNWNKFIEHMTDKGIYQCEFIRMDPKEYKVSIEADIFCTQKASLPLVQQTLTSAIQKMFRYRLGWLGYSIMRSDITDTLEGIGETGGLVDYVILKTPNVDLVLQDKSYYLKLDTLKLNMFYSTRANFVGNLDLDVT